WVPAGRCGYEVNHVADTRLVPPLFRDRCVANGSRTASARAAAVGGAASSPDVGQGTGSKGGRGCPAVGTTTECVGSGISTLPVSTRAASSRTAPPPRGVIRRCGPAVAAGQGWTPGTRDTVRLRRGARGGTVLPGCPARLWCRWHARRPSCDEQQQHRSTASGRPLPP